MGCPVLLCLTVTIINYYRCDNLRDTLRRELKEYVNDNLVLCINMIENHQDNLTT